MLRKRICFLIMESSFDFVAEGLAEFVVSKTPRRLAKKIGEIVLAYLKELR
jgi:hypothetical protein